MKNLCSVELLEFIGKCFQRAATLLATPQLTHNNLYRFSGDGKRECVGSIFTLVKCFIPDIPTSDLPSNTILIEGIKLYESFTFRSPVFPFIWWGWCRLNTWVCKDCYRSALQKLWNCNSSPPYPLQHCWSEGSGGELQ